MAANPNKEVPQVEVQERDLGTLSEIDPSTLNPDFNYRFVHYSPLKISRAKAKGYVVVDPAEEEGIKNVYGDPVDDTGGVYRIGDVVLMKVPKLRHKARRNLIKRKSEARLRGPTKRFKRDARDASVQRGVDVEVITNKDPERD